MKMQWKLLTAVLTALGTACGPDAVQRNQAVRCSLSVPAHSNAVEIQRVLQDVASRKLDACSGALAHPQQYSAELAATEQDDDSNSLQLVFLMRMTHPDGPLPDRF